MVMNVMNTFEHIVESLPSLLQQLLDKKAYPLKDLTEGKINDEFGTSNPVQGVYVVLDKGIPMYIGRSKTLAQRIGTDLRATQKSQATLTYKLIKQGKLNLTTMVEARNYVYRNCTVKMLPVPHVKTRAVFVIYASMKLETIYNSFLES